MPTESLSPHKMGIYCRCISHMIKCDEISDFVYLSFPKCYHITYLLNYQPMTNKYIYICWHIPFWEVSEIPKCHEFYLILIVSFLVHKKYPAMGVLPWLALLPLRVAARGCLAPASPAPDGSRTARPRCDRLDRWWQAQQSRPRLVVYLPL